MKLLLAWLLGVPVLITAMVVARAMSPQGFHAGQPQAPVQAEARVMTTPAA